MFWTASRFFQFDLLSSGPQTTIAYINLVLIYILYKEILVCRGIEDFRFRMGYRTTRASFAFWVMIFVCSFRCKVMSKVTPRYLALFFHLIF